MSVIRGSAVCGEVLGCYWPELNPPERALVPALTLAEAIYNKQTLERDG